VTDRIEGLRIEPISKSHNRQEFKCKKHSLTEYLLRHARRNDEKNISKTFVAVNNENRILAYYSLCTSSIEFEELPDNLSRKLPRYPVPAALITRLAVESSLEGHGLGPELLVDALKQILSVSKKLAIKVVLVDAIDEEAKGFYLHYGFIELPGHDLKLFLPIETIAQLFG